MDPLKPPPGASESPSAAPSADLWWWSTVNRFGQAADSVEVSLGGDPPKTEESRDPLTQPSVRCGACLMPAPAFGGFWVSNPERACANCGACTCERCTKARRRAIVQEQRRALLKATEG